MAKQYKALQSVGRFSAGDFVSGLTEAQIKDLLQRGVIEEIQASESKKEVKTNGE